MNGDLQKDGSWEPRNVTFLGKRYLDLRDEGESSWINPMDSIFNDTWPYKERRGNADIRRRDGVKMEVEIGGMRP